MILRYFFVTFLLCILSSFNQEVFAKDDWLTEIGESVKDKDTIIISEATHSSHDLNKTKIQLTDYLIKNYDFNVLAIETSSIELEYLLSLDLDSLEHYHLADSMDPVYREDYYTDFLLGLYDDSIEISGINWQPVTFDNNSYNAYYSERIYNDIKSIDVEIAEQFKSNEHRIRNISLDSVVIDDYILPFDLISDIHEDYSELYQSKNFKKLEPQTQEFILNRMELFDGPMHESYVKEDMSPIEDYFTRRSQGMLDKFINNHSSTDKTIIWVHNGHTYYDNNSVEFLNDNEEVQFAYEFQTFGELLKEYDEALYTIGIIFNEVDSLTNFYVVDEKIEKITDENFLEGFLSSIAEGNSFYDLKEYDWSSNLFKSFDEGLFLQQYTPNEQFDGILYLDHLEN